MSAAPPIALEQLTLNAAWKTYAGMSIPDHAPQSQRAAMWQAFLCGASTICEIDAALRRAHTDQRDVILDQWASAIRTAIIDGQNPP